MIHAGIAPDADEAQPDATQIPAAERVEDFDKDQLVRQFVVEPDDDFVILRKSKECILTTRFQILASLVESAVIDLGKEAGANIEPGLIVKAGRSRSLVHQIPINRDDARYARFPQRSGDGLTIRDMQHGPFSNRLFSEYVFQCRKDFRSISSKHRFQFLPRACHQRSHRADRCPRASATTCFELAISRRPRTPRAHLLFGDYTRYTSWLTVEVDVDRGQFAVNEKPFTSRHTERRADFSETRQHNMVRVRECLRARHTRFEVKWIALRNP